MIVSQSIHARISPAFTGWPSFTSKRSTVPLLGDRISFCIFMASTTSKPCPASTFSPACTSTRMIFPGIGARICWRPSASSAPCRRPRHARGSVTSAVNSWRPVCSVSVPEEVDAFTVEENRENVGRDFNGVGVNNFAVERDSPSLRVALEFDDTPRVVYGDFEFHGVRSN